MAYLALGLAGVFGVQVLIDRGRPPPPAPVMEPQPSLRTEPWVFERRPALRRADLPQRERMDQVAALFDEAMLRSSGGELSEDEALVVEEIGEQLARLGEAAFLDFYVLMRNERYDRRVLGVPLRVLETTKLGIERGLLWRCLSLNGELARAASLRLASLCDARYLIERLKSLGSAPLSAGQRAFLVRAQRDINLSFGTIRASAGDLRAGLAVYLAASEELPEEAAAAVAVMMNDPARLRDALWVLTQSRRPVFLERLQALLSETQDEAVFADVCRVLGAYRVVSSAPVLLEVHQASGSYRKIAIENALSAIAVRRVDNEDWPAWWQRLEPLWLKLDEQLAELKSGRLPRDQRLRTLAELEDLRDPAVAEAAAELLKDEDPLIREAAARVLGTLALPAGLRELCGMLEGDRPRERSLAHRALKNMFDLELGPDRAAWEEEVLGEDR